MTILVHGLLGSLMLTGGYGQAAGPVLVCYVDPRAVQFVSSNSDADPFGIDPRAVTLQS